MQERIKLVSKTAYFIFRKGEKSIKILLARKLARINELLIYISEYVC